MTDFQQGDIVSVAEKPDRYVVGGAVMLQGDNGEKIPAFGLFHKTETGLGGAHAIPARLMLIERPVIAIGDAVKAVNRKSGAVSIARVIGGPRVADQGDVLYMLAFGDTDPFEETAAMIVLRNRL
jgi:hypothetical protein